MYGGLWKVCLRCVEYCEYFEQNTFWIPAALKIAKLIMSLCVYVCGQVFIAWWRLDGQDRNIWQFWPCGEVWLVLKRKTPFNRFHLRSAKIWKLYFVWWRLLIMSIKGPSKDSKRSMCVCGVCVWVCLWTCMKMLRCDNG